MAHRVWTAIDEDAAAQGKAITEKSKMLGRDPNRSFHSQKRIATCCVATVRNKERWGK